MSESHFLPFYSVSLVMGRPLYQVPVEALPESVQREILQSKD